MRSESHKTDAPKITNSLGQGRSRYGTAQPQILVRLPEGASHRAVNAALHTLAAAVELATPEGERWLVQTEGYYDASGRVWLELAEGTEEEAKRGMAVLGKLVG